MNNKSETLQWAHPLVREWFINQFGSPTEPQELGWPHILAGHTTLISAPTGSGKTFAAFLTCIDRLVSQSLSSQLADRTEVIYISPLKALSNDIQKNLQEPLQAIDDLAKGRGLSMQPIRVSVRTGDTSIRERQAMLKNPPHILVTTPESLYILLTAEKSRAMLSQVTTVIVDEVHALVNDKRGAHLALTLERLAALTLRPPIRIGLSATQKPIEKVAAFLAGNNRPAPVIVNVGHIRPWEISIETPATELGAVATHEMWDQIYERIAELARQNRSTLVFVNTRRMAERVAHHLAELLGQDQVLAHHGSLSRKLRLKAEHKLKNGELKALVATASLELGIDIGAVDLVCQIGSPRSIAVALQRIGRAGHWRGAIPKGRFFATTRDELIECAALIYAILSGDLDQLIVPEQPIDILAQQIIAICATGDWLEEDLFNLIKNAYPYSQLTRTTFNDLLQMLAEGVASSRGRYSAYLFRDSINGVVRARRGSRLAAITNGGAIPDNGLFTVVAEPEGIVVGSLDEDFAVESNRGDIILLGTTSWKIQRIEAAGKVIVADAHGSPPSVPFWRGEAPARTDELSWQISQFREKLQQKLFSMAVDQRIHWLMAECHLDQFAARQMVEYVSQGIAVLGAIPTQKTVIAERFFDESGGMQLIIHAPFGARINKAWALALRKKFCRSFNFELQASATDDGLNIALAEQHSFPLADVFRFLHPNTLREVLVQAVLQSPLFTSRWRWCACRALAILRFKNGKKTPPNILRMLADDLLAAVFPDAAACQDNLAGKDIELPDHLLIEEVMKEVLTQALDLPGFNAVLNRILDGSIQCLAVDTPLPSPFAHEILNANPYAFLDDAPLEERRARAVELRRVVPDAVLQGAGRLDPSAIQLVQEQAWPKIRSADELHDLLQTLIAFPEDQQYQSFFITLSSTGRASSVELKGIRFWYATEKKQLFFAVFDGDMDSLVTMIRGWLFHSGPITANELSHRLRIPLFDIDQALLKLESTGLILRGNFRTNSADSLEWCERRLLARIHRLTLSELRKEIEPVTALQFMNWLLTWQHVAPGTQLRGEQGLLEIIRQLQGFELPANAWEKQIFAKRVADYDPQALERLCLTGVVGWGRLSPHPAENENRRISPTSIAPITFFVRDQVNHFVSHDSQKNVESFALSAVANNVYHFLQNHGASFFTDLVNGCHHLKSEIESGLWELVAAGLVTADGFDNLRALIDPRRRSGKQGARARMRHSMGRWSLLKTAGYLDAQILLKRYGVVFRELLALESHVPRWRDLLEIFRTLEDRGEIRSGRFVNGFYGEQFALPYAVESLRQFRKKSPDNPPITISAVDPLNLTGILIPGERTPALSTKSVMIGTYL